MASYCWSHEVCAPLVLGAWTLVYLAGLVFKFWLSMSAQDAKHFDNRIYVYIYYDYKSRLHRLNKNHPYFLFAFSPPHPDVLTLSLSHLSKCYDITHTTVTSECQCHGHADSCHFSQRAWLSSGGTSGGVCDDCRHNTVGRRCQRCRHGYHHHPSLPLNSPHTCTRKRLQTWGLLLWCGID